MAFWMSDEVQTPSPASQPELDPSAWQRLGRKAGKKQEIIDVKEMCKLAEVSCAFMASQLAA